MSKLDLISGQSIPLRRCRTVYDLAMMYYRIKDRDPAIFIDTKIGRDLYATSSFELISRDQRLHFNFSGEVKDCITVDRVIANLGGLEQISHYSITMRIDGHHCDHDVTHLRSDSNIILMGYHE